ncbi:sensor histidine kinase [Bacillus marinisedimentorum]|uniref:sensor histidine kinase n=1 Tax=Bacillus marinisedimentorum TaxID=1821260 RepID=UPI0007E162A3|nr:HAMP domain-containing sensor histidine kinase [Bacillus marinisedimentorum]
MKKISFKLGVLFLVFMLIIESLWFFILYTGLANDRIDEEIQALLARGNSHRDVLEKNFDQSTISHVALMESETETAVVITDGQGNILGSSNEITTDMSDHIADPNEEIGGEGEVLENKWQDASHISTVSPIMVDGERQGLVYMFLNTSFLQNTINRLSSQFLGVGAFSLLFTVATIFILTRLITIPLVRMKEATQDISEGKLTVSLEYDRNDELGELARTIQKLASSLERLRRERNEFLSAISHELRTPLTYLKGYADIAGRGSLPEEERQKYLGILKEEAAHLARLVQGLFDLAKMDQHEFKIDRQNVALCSFLEEVRTKTIHMYNEKKVHLELDCREPIAAYIDPVRFEQVMINLIDNALKHTPAGKRVLLKARSERNHITIEVADEGIGIPERELPYIFDRLYRVEKSRSRESGGSGLGLAIAKEIVELHEGTISAASKVHTGTTITIRLKRSVDHGPNSAG